MSSGKLSGDCVVNQLLYYYINMFITSNMICVHYFIIKIINSDSFFHNTKQQLDILKQELDITVRVHCAYGLQK